MNIAPVISESQSLRLMSAALAAASDAMMIARSDLTPDGTLCPPVVVYANPAFTRMTGYGLREVLGRNPSFLQGSGTDPEAVRQLRHDLGEGRACRIELLNYRKDGVPFWVELDISPIAEESGDATYFISVQRDVGSRHAEIAELKANESWFRLLFEDSPAAMWVMDRATTRFLSVNAAAVRIYGWSREQFLQMTLVDLCRAVDREPALRFVRNGINERTLLGPYVHVTASGQEREVMVQRQAIDFFGRAAAFVAVTDVSDAMQVRRETERRQARLTELAATLHRRTEELGEALRLARLGTWRWQSDGDRMEWSDDLYAMFGRERTAGEPTLSQWLALPLEEDRPAMELAMADMLATGKRTAFEFRGLGPGGEMRHFWVEARPAGHEHEVLGLCQDITARRRAEAALSEAEKLSAIAQLTGGVAHDFNNLLTIISLNLEMLGEMLPPTDPMQDFITPALSAAHSGADLTSSLLSFARRQPLRPERLELGALLERVAEFGRRSLGEGHRIELRQTDGVWPVRVDRVQLETALLNLMINARDAMPGGGTILVETTSLPAGDPRAEAWHAPDGQDLVVISVSDHGCGITPEQMTRVFDPFFTTKPPGKGTGLGLSMVFGFAKQSGGHIDLESEPGFGTVARLFLPRLADDGVALAPTARVLRSRLAGRRLLLVEDKADVRATVVALAQSLGLHVTAMANAEDAMLELCGSTEFDLLLTDVVLGEGMNGFELSGEARRLRPGLRVLRMSGFNELNMPRNGRGEADGHLLVKPFGRDRFAAALDAVLAAPAY